MNSKGSAWFLCKICTYVHLNVVVEFSKRKRQILNLTLMYSPKSKTIINFKCRYECVSVQFRLLGCADGSGECTCFAVDLNKVL